jgi:ribosome-associated toxin RatA of RatAB toxin-antitoxin module
MPQYSEVKIVEREGNRMVIERKGTVRGKEVFWRSETEVRAPNMIKSKQVVGPIPDMEIVWEFEAREKKTYIRLIHRFEYKKIPVIGGLIGRLIVARIVKKMAQETLEAVKKEAESV